MARMKKRINISLDSDTVRYLSLWRRLGEPNSHVIREAVKAYSNFRDNREKLMKLQSTDLDGVDAPASEEMQYVSE